MTVHWGNHVEAVDDAFVLVCECGWRSGPSSSAGALGYEWDEHRTSEGAPPDGR